VRISKSSELVFHTTELLAMAPRYLKKGSAAENSTNTLSLEVGSIVKEVIDDIRQNGDDAVRKYSGKFDKWSPQSFKLSKEQIDAAIAAVPKHTIEDIRQVQANVRQFAQAQRDSIRDFELETQPVSRNYLGTLLTAFDRS
jgi:histidinol dehydrogenase